MVDIPIEITQFSQDSVTGVNEDLVKKFNFILQTLTCVYAINA